MTLGCVSKSIFEVKFSEVKNKFRDGKSFKIRSPIFFKVKIIKKSETETRTENLLIQNLNSFRKCSWKCF